MKTWIKTKIALPIFLAALSALTLAAYVPYPVSSPGNHLNLAYVKVGTICSSSPCSIADQSGSWVSSITRGSTGVYTVHVNSGNYSTGPTCTCSSQGGGTNVWCEIQPSSSTSITVNLFTAGSANANPVLADSQFQILCMGAH